MMKRIFLGFWFLFLVLTVGRAADTWSEPANLDMLNTNKDEFAPSWNRFEGRLYFNSDRSGYSMFFVSSGEEGEFGGARLLPDPVNSSGNNQSYISFLSTEVAYLSTFRLSERRSYLNIFKSFRKKNSWGEPMSLDSLVSDAFVSHPAISPDGRAMIFSSNMSSEYEDTDLWQATRLSNGAWGSLIRLDELNSPGNEITPCFASDDTLYFATDGQEGPGGFDIFISIKYEGKWQRPALIAGINTEFDESDICVLPGGNIIFASNRPGGSGGLDLYHSSKISEDSLKDLLPETEIRLESPVFSIEARRNSKYRLYPLIPYLTANADIVYESDAQGGHLSVDRLLKISPALLISNSMELLSGGIDLRLPTEDLDCPGILRHNAVALKSFRAKLPEKITFTVNENREFCGALILSSNKAAYKPFRVGQGRTLLVPPMLEINIDAVPENSLNNWECTLIIGNREIETGISGNSLPSKQLIDLEPYADRIWAEDSLFIKISGQGENGLLSDRFPFRIYHNEAGEYDAIITGGKKYEQFFLVLAGPDDLRSGIYDEFLKSIAERCESANKIIVQYLSDTGHSRISAEAVENILRTENIPSITEYKESTDYLEYSEGLAPFIIRILLEKKLP